jgi:hypothetical protein
MTVIAVVIAGFTASLGVPTARTDQVSGLPTCAAVADPDLGSQPLFFLTTPKQVALGRSQPIIAEFGDSYTQTDIDRGSLAVAVQDAATDEVLSSSLVLQKDYPDDNGDDGELGALTPTPAHPNLLVVVTYDTQTAAPSSDGDGADDPTVSCSQTITRLVMGVTGSEPTFRFANDELVDFNTPPGAFPVEVRAMAPHAGCARQVPGRPVLSISLRNQVRRIDLNPCEPRMVASQARFLGLRLRYEHIDTRGVAELALFAAGPRRSFVRNYRVSYSVADKRLFAGTMRYASAFTAGYRIYQGTDDFVNICIDEGHTVRSSGGRLYCFVPGVDFTSLKIRR